MKHLDEGELRRWIDEPESLPEDAQTHARTCDSCGELLAELQSNADRAARLLYGDVSTHTAAAFARVRRARVVPNVARTEWRKRALTGPLVAAAAAVIVVCTLAFTPLGGYANAFLTIFQPKEFVPVDLTQADIQQLRISPQARELGRMFVVRPRQMSTFSSVDAARAKLQFAPRLPQQLPAGIGSQRSYVVGYPAVYQYTFSAAKAQAFEAKSHRRLPPMPPALNGTTVTVRVGESFGAHYGVAKTRTEKDEPRSGLSVFEMQIPTVTSKGASFQELERYMLSMPGISDDLASQLRALGDLQNRMPVPIDTSKENAQQVSVDGVSGLAIGDNTGLGAGVVWQKNGFVYGVMGGEVTMDQVLAVANGLR